MAISLHDFSSKPTQASTNAKIINSASDVWKFNNCKALDVQVIYPSSYGFSTRSKDISGGEFNVITTSVPETSSNKSSAVRSIDTISIDQFSMTFNDDTTIYPVDISGGSIRSEIKRCNVQEINTNQDNVNVLGSFTHIFAYTSTDTGLASYHGLYGVWGIYLPGFNSIVESVNQDASVNAVRTYVSFTRNSPTLPLSGAIVQMNGTGTVKFSAAQKSGLIVGTLEQKNTFYSTNEICGTDFNDNLNINGKIGTDKDVRWGTPLWSKAFSGGVNFISNMEFNSRKESNNGKDGEILHEITNLVLSCSSLSALKNRRIRINGLTEKEFHTYSGVNGTTLKTTASINSVSYEPSEFSTQYYEQFYDFNITNANKQTGYIDSIINSSIVGTISSSSMLSCCSGIKTFPNNNVFILSEYKKSDQNLETDITYTVYDGCLWALDDISLTTTKSADTSGRQYLENITLLYTNCIYSCPDTVIDTFVEGTISTPDESTDINFNSEYTVLSSITTTVENKNLSKTYKYNVYDPKFWKVSSTAVSTVPASICSVISSGFTLPTAYKSGEPTSSISTLTGFIRTTGATCCSGTYHFPADFILTNTSVNNGIATLTYGISSTCGQDTVLLNVYSQAYYAADLFIKLNACSSGTLTVGISADYDYCESTKDSSVSIVFTEPPSGYEYSEYATSFVQEYRKDGRHVVVENMNTSNVYQDVKQNNGIPVASCWKRFQDGVGLGGDAPDYDTIYNPKTKSTYEIPQWKEFGKWYVGQMSVGTPRKAVIFGGHEINKDVGKTLVGSGLHASPTTPRVFVWDQTAVSPEDTYLKNYYARRFNTHYSNGTVPISSNSNVSSMSCYIFDAQSDIQIERYGTVHFDGSTQSISVEFDKSLPVEVDQNYSISMTCDDNVKVWWEEKTPKGFTLKCELKEWKGTVDYLVTAIIKVTEQDITDKGSTEGYIFDK